MVQVKTVNFPAACTVGILVDGEIDLSTRNGNVRVFINSRYLKSNPVLINKTVINRDHLSTWLIVGKIGQGMRSHDHGKCNSNSNV